MKKIIVLCLVCVVVFAFCSCGSETTPATGTNTPKEEVAEEPATEDSAEDEVIVVADNDDIYFAITGITHDDFYGDGIAVSMENKTDKTVIFSWKDTSCNGYMVDNWFSEEVQPGKKANSAVYFVESDLEKNKIDVITEIEYTLWVWDTEDWSADSIYEETFTYEP